MGCGSREYCGTRGITAGMETNDAGHLWGCKNILRDSRENIAVLDFDGASALTSESNIHFFQMQNF